MNSINTLRRYISICVYLFKVFIQLLWGIWKLSRLKHAPVTIFGGSHLLSDNYYMKQAHTLAHKLMESDIPVLTGGGPGIMEAANCGAVGNAHYGQAVIKSVGISVKDLKTQEAFNKCAQMHIIMENFFARKWLLVNYSIGFAIFPGGFGTLDELSELLTLIQYKQRKPAPIVLIGIEYWQPFIDWMDHSALIMGLISQKDRALFKLTDSIEEATQLLEKYAKQPFII
jgi:uncharacterized protein (TIGR00730 family)